MMTRILFGYCIANGIAARRLLSWLAFLTVGLAWLPTTANATTYYWDGNGTTAGAGTTPTGTWGTSNFWNTDSTGGSGGTFTNTTAIGDTAIFSAGSDATGAFTVTVSGTQNIGNITFDEGAVTISGGTQLDLNNGGTIQTAAGTVSAENITTNLLIEGNTGAYTFTSASTTTAATLNFGGQVFGAANGSHTSTLTLNGSNTGNNTISGVISDGGTKLAVTKGDSGTWVLSGINTYTGATTVGGGTMAIAASGSLSTSTAVTVSNGATFAPQPANGGAMTGGASLVLNSGAILNMSGDSAGGTFDVKTNSTSTAGALTLAGATLDFDLGTSSGATVTDKLLAGALTLSGTNNINITGFGSTALTAGTYPLVTVASGIVTADFHLNTTSIVVNGATYGLSLSNTGSTAENLVVGAGNNSTLTLPSSTLALNERTSASGTPASTTVADGSSTSSGHFTASSTGTNTLTVSPSGSTLVAASGSASLSVGWTTTTAAGAQSGQITIVNNDNGGDVATPKTEAVSGGVYDFANAKYTGGVLAFGNVHTGASLSNKTVAFGNQTITSASFQDLLNVSATTGNAAVTATGFTGLAASTSGATTSNLTVAASTATAGSLASTETLTLVSNANGVSGLSNGTATVVGSPAAITTTGGVYDFANAKYTGGALAFGNVRTGASLSNKTVAFGNQTVTSASFQDLLNVSATTGNTAITATGFTGLAPSTSGATTSNLTVAASAATAGSLASTETLTLVSNANGVSGLSNGTATVVGSPAAITTTGGVYDFADAKYTGGVLAFGNVRTGASPGNQTIAFGNQTITNASFQDLLNVSASTGNAAITATGFTGLAPSTSGATTSNLTLAASTATAGSLASTETLTLVSNANGVSGLSNGTATVVGSPAAVTTTGGVYDFANAKYTGGALAFGNVRTGASLSNKTVAFGNQTITNASFQDLLNVSATTGNTAVTATGFTGLAPSTSGATTSNLTLAASTATAGSLASTETLSLVSNANGVAGLSNGTASVVGSPAAITTTGGVYDFANAKYTGGVLAFGNVRTGSSPGNQTVAFGNQTITSASFQDLLNVSATTGNTAVTATGFTGLAASTSGATTNNLSLAASTTTAGSLASTETLTLVSNANGVAGLSNGTATVVGSPVAITTTGGVYDFADAKYTGGALAFGNVRTGASLGNQTVAFGNQTITNASFQDLLNVSATTGNTAVTATGFTGLAPSTSGATTGNLTVAVSTATAGSLASTETLSLVSNANGVAGLSNGTASVVGSPAAVTTTGGVYDYANPGYTGGNLDFGNVHIGASPANQSVAFTNAAITNATFQDSLDVSATTGNSKLNATGFTALAANAAAQNLSIAANTASPGSLAATLSLTLTSDANGISGLSNTSLTPVNSITVTGNVYSGLGVWNTDGNGNWSDFSKWTTSGGAPGLASGFQTGQDTATFAGAAATSNPTVSLQGANPAVSSLTFNNATKSYTIDAAGGGTLTLDNTVNSASAAIAVNNGSHFISAPLNLNSNTVVTVTNSTDSLTISGAIGGNRSLTLGGAGTLVLSNGANGYTGGTVVNGGVLRVTNASGSATGAGSVTLNGGTLSSGATGVIGGAVSAGTGNHTIAPGGVGSIGSLSLTSASGLSLDADSTLDFDVAGAASDALSVTGQLSLSGEPNLTIAATGTLAGDYTLATFASTSGLSSSSFAISGMPTGYKLQVDPTDLMLVPANTSTLSRTPAHMIVRSMVGGSQTGAVTLDNISATDDATYSTVVTGDATATAATGSVAHGGTTNLAIGFTDYSTTGPRTGTVTITNTANASDAFNNGVNNVFTLDAGSAVVDNRVVTASNVDFGRVMVNVAQSGSSTLSTSGDDDHFSRVTVNGTLFNAANVTSNYTLNETFNTTGPFSGTATTLTTTGEGLTGEAPINVAVPATATVVDNRVVTASAVSFGRVMVNQAVSGSSSLTSSASDSTATRIEVADAAADSNGISVTGGNVNNIFDGTTSDTRTVGGTFTTTGNLSGTFNLTNSTTENGNAGLTGQMLGTTTLSYTATSLTDRPLTAPPTVDLGKFLLNSGSHAVGANNLYVTSSSGDQNSYANAQLSSPAGAVNGISVSGSGTLDGVTTQVPFALSGTVGTTTSAITTGSLALINAGETGVIGTQNPTPVSVSFTYAVGAAKAAATPGTNLDSFVASQALTAAVAAGAQYTNLASNVDSSSPIGYMIYKNYTDTSNNPADWHNTEAKILGGTSTDGNIVSMNWRARNAAEIPGASTSPLIKSAPIGGLLSDVVELTGMALPVQPPLSAHPSTPSAVQTDIFVLQMTYDPSAIPASFGSEAVAAANGFIYLGWLNSDFDGDPSATTNDRWTNAVNGNFYADLNAEFSSVTHFSAATGFIGSYTDYFDGTASNATSSGLKDLGADSFQLGDWGVDPEQHTVWAVVNHNSQFAVVPEPSSAALALLGLAACGLWRRRRAKTSSTCVLHRKSRIDG